MRLSSSTALQSKAGPIRSANRAPSAARGERRSRAASNLTRRRVSNTHPLPLSSHRTRKQDGLHIYTTSIQSPVGTLHLAASDCALLAVVWRRSSTPQLPFDTAIEQPEHAVLRVAVHQLNEYFSGGRRTFDLPLEFRGTDFQRHAWAALLTIPYGETRSYLDMARALGNPAAVRAVGAANGRNPISIVAPCHRVIGSSGDLTGFGGGLEAKAWLLAHESPQRDLLATI